MNILKSYGWNESLLQQKQTSVYRDFLPGRVTVSHKTCYEVISEEGLYTCELTGNMLYGREHADYPCTGDWVLFQPMDADKGIIHYLIPRQKTLYRLKSGAVSEKQAIASHVDKAFIVQSLDANFNVRRIERHLLQLADEKIQPLLVLTKTDLGFNKDEVENALKHLTGKIPVFYTSIQLPDSIELLRKQIAPGETVVFTGSSGVGKSTLINVLCQKEILATAAISNSTGKGRHTTTRREMILLEGAGILIDTPGVKVFGVTNDDADSLSEVLDISSFEGQCRFKDCQHINEKGCAVIQAVESGEIDQGVYENYLKLRKEAWHFTTSVHEKRKHEKSFSKMVKEVKKSPYKK
ncbi:ribosome small subunit-dependent GTPase A [Sunxiuqinia sp. A32]|uniref:ribosome small subunit-dependent GTPase A n=1 Tax=Sunxiuqinia sp. A32 TaxID=3461496 RepID=UPI004046635A